MYFETIRFPDGKHSLFVLSLSKNIKKMDKNKQIQNTCTIIYRIENPNEPIANVVINM